MWRRKATSTVERTEILEGLKVRLPELLAREVGFIPYPSRWLNEERWKDPVENNGRPVARRSGDRHAVHQERVREAFEDLLTERLNR